MTQISDQELLQLANLAKLQLNDADMAIAEQLSESVSYVSNLAEINTENVPPTFYTTSAKNVMAEDEVDESVMLTQEQALANVPSAKNGYFVVKRIL